MCVQVWNNGALVLAQALEGINVRCVLPSATAPHVGTRQGLSSPSHSPIQNAPLAASDTTELVDEGEAT